MYIGSLSRFSIPQKRVKLQALAFLLKGSHDHILRMLDYDRLILDLHLHLNDVVVLLFVKTAILPSSEGHHLRLLDEVTEEVFFALDYSLS